MIIKLLTQGQRTNFTFMVQYLFDHDQGGHYLSRNLNLVDHMDQAAIAKRFIENDRKYVPKRKNGVRLRHNIFSLKRVEKIPLQRQCEILTEAAQYFTDTYWRDVLSYGALHVNSGHIHYHILSSPNFVGSKQKVRITPQQLQVIKCQMERFVQKKFPELELPTRYNQQEQEQEQAQTHSIGDKEYFLKDRTKAPSKKDILKEVLTEVFADSSLVTFEELEQVLNEHQIQLVQRGNTITAHFDGIRARLRTLQLQEDYNRMHQRFNTYEERMRQLDSITQNQSLTHSQRRHT